jgi:hypothetical protein
VGAGEQVNRQPKYPDIAVTLAGTDGNVFGIIGRVQVALRREVSREVGDAFAREAMGQDSYDAVLRLAMATVTVR